MLHKFCSLIDRTNFRIWCFGMRAEYSLCLPSCLICLLAVGLLLGDWIILLFYQLMQ